MDSTAERASEVLRRLGIARSRDLEAADVSRSQIKRLHESGVIERIGRGLYRNPREEYAANQSIAEVARRVPRGVVCLLSALRFHGLTTQNPVEVWLAIDQKAWRPKLDYPPLRLVYMSGISLAYEVETHEIEHTPIRVFSAAKTVADCFKFRNKVGNDVAVEALREYVRIHPKKLEAVWLAAKADRVAGVIQPYLEATT